MRLDTPPAPDIAEHDWRAAIELVERAGRVLLVTHKKPDGDAIGTLLGMGHALESAGKQVTMACADHPNGGLARLPGAERIVHDLGAHYSSEAPPDASLPWDLVVSLDASGLDRLGAVYESHQALYTRLPVIDLDHHFTNDRFGVVNLVDAAAAAAAEVATIFLGRLGITPNALAATCLLAGMMTDSLSFQTESTTPRTLRLAASLVEAGAPISGLAYQLLRQRPRSNAILWSKALGTLQFGANGRLAWIEVTQVMVEASGPGAETGGFSGFAGSIAGVDVGMVIEEGADGNVYAGFRSASVDVAALASRFGGGGHQRAAGCYFSPPATIADARAALIAAVETILAEASARA